MQANDKAEAATATDDGAWVGGLDGPMCACGDTAGGLPGAVNVQSGRACDQLAA